MVEKHTIHEKGVEGERIFREYCKEHGIKLSSPFNSHPPLMLNYYNVFETREVVTFDGLKPLKEHVAHTKIVESKPPTIQDYHYKIMEDRGLLNEKYMVDYCSFENRSLYEVKY